MSNTQIIIDRRGENYEVARVSREVLGAFADYDMASLFAKAVGDRPVPPVSVPAPEAPPSAAEPDLPVSSKPNPSKYSGQDGLDSFETALDRVEAGEPLKEVAQDAGLPFGQLRGKWAAAIRNGSRKKPAPVPVPVVAETDDTPVSGGVGAVLARGGGPAWTDAMDAALLDAGEDEIDAVAARLGVSGADARRRIATVQAEVARSLRE